MKAKLIETFLVVFVVTLGLSVARADQAQQYPADATFTTLITTPLGIEGLTGDNSGNLYTVGRHVNVPAEQGLPCPVWKINLTSPSLEVGWQYPSPQHQYCVRSIAD